MTNLGFYFQTSHFTSPSVVFGEILSQTPMQFKIGDTAPSSQTRVRGGIRKWEYHPHTIRLLPSMLADVWKLEIAKQSIFDNSLIRSEVFPPPLPRTSLSSLFAAAAAAAAGGSGVKIQRHFHVSLLPVSRSFFPFSSDFRTKSQNMIEY